MCFDNKNFGTRICNAFCVCVCTHTHQQRFAEDLMTSNLSDSKFVPLTNKEMKE